MKFLDAQQGSQEWSNFRAHTLGCSDLAEAMGLRGDRNDLLKRKKFGLNKVFSPYKQSILSNGHVIEDVARGMIEKELGIEFFPVVLYDDFDKGRLVYSSDGLSMDNSKGIEVKSYNTSAISKNRVSQCISNQFIEYHMPQIQGGLLISGAEVIYLVVCNMEKIWVHPIHPDKKWFQKIRLAVNQFTIDMDNFVDKQFANPIIKENHFLIQYKQGALSDPFELEHFGEKLLDFVDGLNLNPETDDDFAQLESDTKILDKVESYLEDHENKRLLYWKNYAREHRLACQKKVKDRKAQIKSEIIEKAEKSFEDYKKDLLGGLSNDRVKIQVDFEAACKGKKSIKSIHNAVDSKLAHAKIEAQHDIERRTILTGKEKFQQEIDDAMLLDKRILATGYCYYERLKLLSDFDFIDNLLESQE